MLKNILYTIVFLFVSTNLYSSDWITSYEKLYRDAEDDKITKPVFLIVARTTCHYCSEEFDNINNSVQFRNFLFKNFTPAIIPEDIKMLPVTLQATNTPTIHILDPKTLKPLVSPAVGAIPIDILKKWLTEILIKIFNIN